MEVPTREPNDLTPEERLFKIIQETDGENKKPQAVYSSSDAQPASILKNDFGEALPSVTQTPRVSSGTVAGRLPVRQMLQRVFSITFINGILAVFLCVSVVFVMSKQLPAKTDWKKEFLKKTSLMKGASIPLPARLFSLADVGNLSEVFSARNPFQPYRPPEIITPVKADEPAPASSSLLTAIQNLRVSGIFMGEEPEGLLEATDEKKTYAVTVGSHIKGVTVKNIKPDRVILSDGQSEQVLK